MSVAALYLRQSDYEPEGIDRQREQGMQLIAEKGWQLGPVYVDNDVSASRERGEGTGWAKMLANVGVQFEALVVTDGDRLVRRMEDAVTFVKSGVPVLSLDGLIDTTTAEGESRFYDMARRARFEVRRKSERQRRANERRARQGKRTLGRRPFGFDDDGVTVRDDEAEAIRSGYSDCLSGIPLAAIARDWNSRGFVTGQKRYRGARDEQGRPIEPSPWRHDSVRAVLLNPRYAGKVAYKGEIVSETAEWPAIVPESTWLAAQAALTNPARRTGQPGGRRLLSGLAFCGVCGEAQNTVHAGGGARRGIANYRCSASAGHVARMAEPVDEYVTAAVVGRLSRPDAAELLFNDDRPDVEALQTEAIGIRERLDALAVDFADGALTTSQLRTATERLRARLAGVETLLVSSARVDVLGPVVGAEDVAAAWAALDIPHQRAIIDTLMEVTLYPPGRGTRTFRPESVDVRWRRG